MASNSCTIAAVPASFEAPANRKSAAAPTWRIHNPIAPAGLRPPASRTAPSGRVSEYPMSEVMSLLLLSLSKRVADDGAVDAVSVARVLVEKGRRVGARPHGDEPVVAAQAPAAVGRVPLDAAAHVARQRRVIASDPEARSREGRQAADPACRVRHERRMRRQRHDEVAGVVQLIGPFLIAGQAAELQVLRDAERTVHLALDADDAVDVVGEGGAQRVVAEA